MKKLISTLAFVLCFVAMSFAQDGSNTAATQGADALLKSKETGAYVYTMPTSATQERVDKAASYYPNYFTVEFDATSHEAAVNFVGEDEKACRAVMMRFLSGCGIQYVLVDEDTLRLSEFMEQHLQ